MSTTEYRAPAPLRTSEAHEPPMRSAVRRIPADVWAVGALMVIAALLRFPTIAGQSYWADEALTVHEVGHSFSAMMSGISHFETTPPLYFILAWAWAHLFGTGEIALRSLSALAGVAVVPIAYLCGRELVSRRAGVIAAAFAAVNPFLVWYSQEARAYMLLIALSGASFLWFIKAEREPSRRHVVGWAIFSALALTTHFFAGFLVAPEAVWLLWRARSRLVFLAAGALVAVQAALVPLVLQDTGHGLGWIHHVPLVNRVSQIPTEFAVMTVYRHVSVSEGLWAGAIAIVLAVLLLALAGGPAERRGARLAGALAGIVIVVPLVIGVIRPADDVFLVRNLAPAWIPLAVALAAACAVPRARDVGAAVAAVLIIMFAIATIEIATSPVFQRADWRGVGRTLGVSTAPRAILVVGGNEAAALKIFVHGVKWNQPPRTKPVFVDEIDVVGSIARAQLRGRGKQFGHALPTRLPVGAVYLGHRWVRNFDIARYQLIHPWRLDTKQISARAGHFFRHHHAPTQLLILFASGVPRRGPAPPGLEPGGFVRPHRARHGRAHHGLAHRRHASRPQRPQRTHQRGHHHRGRHHHRRRGARRG